MLGRISLITLLILALPVLSRAQQVTDSELLARSNEILLELQRYDAQLVELESEFGPFHDSLLEPLQSIVQLLAEQGNYRQVAEVQTRLLGVMRTVLGLEHPDLIPLLREIIANQQRLQNWEEVADHLELIRLIAVANYGAQSDQAFEAIEHQALWAQSMVYLERDDGDQARRFMESREIYEDLLDRAEERWGEDAGELIPYYYKRARNLGQMVGLLNSDDSIAREVVEEVIRTDGFSRLEQGSAATRSVFNPDAVFGLDRRFAVIEKDGLIGEGYLRQGRGFIDRISEIAEAQGDLETQALAELYRGDFNVLMERNSGARNYRDAREMLIEAGIDAARIDRFFSLPMPIPMPDFFTSFAELEAYQQSLMVGDRETGGAFTHVGMFHAWAEAAPALQKPVHDEPLFNVVLPEHAVEMSFNLNSRGNVSSVEVISASSAERGIEREAWRALRDIKFRPYFYEGRSRRLRDLQIRYIFAAID